MNLEDNIMNPARGSIPRLVRGAQEMENLRRFYGGAMADRLNDPTVY